MCVNVMPHVVLTGEVDVTDIFQHLQSLKLHNQQSLIRTSTKYLASDDTAMIIESLAGTPPKLQHFLILINRRKDGLVIRIHPYSTVDKTTEVKQLLAEVAKQILQSYPHLTIGKTNLQRYADGFEMSSKINHTRCSGKCLRQVFLRIFTGCWYT